jgi:uncharacterized RDD family membrane protein YckC
MQSPAPGEPTPSTTPIPPPPSGPPPGYAAAEYGSPAVGWAGPLPQQTVVGPAPGLAYAGFWWRVLASLIDGVILSAITALGSQVGGRAIWSIISLLYLPVTWAWLGETPGHRVLGMEIRRVEDGQRPGVGQVVIRWIGYYISVITIGIGFIIAGFDPRKQALHDKIANTVVVRRVA